ncbi:MAG: ABC transporter substrate-binding protein [Paracoccaceae bacterium]
MFKSLVVALFALAAPLATAAPIPADRAAIVAEARGETVYWHAWGGSPRINAYIAWAGQEMAARYGVTVRHVKLSDTADAVSRVIAEKTAGRDEGGAVDLIWINGENFASMKAAGLLFGPWAEDMPNWALLATETNPALTSDFALPTDGLEAPWGAARLIFYHDAARLPDPPRTIAALLDWAKANPGRFTFPQPPDFLGVTFLKQALHDLTPDPALLQAPPDKAGFDAATAPLWRYLEELTPALWRAGRAYPQSEPRQMQLMADGEIDLAANFGSGPISAAIASFELPETARSYTLNGGTIGNAHFLAIPYNASAKAGAMLLADFLLTPEAQARKLDPVIWGDATVLEMDKLSAADRARFDAINLGPATLTPGALGPALAEPQAAWTPAIEAEWTVRFGGAR